MTPRESVPRGNRPATDAGKALVEWAENAVPEQVEVWRDHAALIEEEARQPALDAYRSLIEWLPTLIDGKDRARTNDLIRAAIEDGKRTEARLLDEVGVAGLTAEDHQALAEAAEERAFRGVAGLTEERTND